MPEVTLEADEPAPAASPQAPNPPQDPLTLAEEARRAGDYAQARELYRRAGEGTGVTAEAALVALARMELSLGHAAAARDATKRRQERFGRGTLSPEALWIDVRSYRQSGDLSKARELANQLVEGWPSSPQARAAAQWLGAR
jgi:Tfp pilus assembly protein PilF